jgi:hypothetical protein
MCTKYRWLFRQDVAPVLEAPRRRPESARMRGVCLRGGSMSVPSHGRARVQRLASRAAGTCTQAAEGLHRDQERDASLP